MEDLRQIQLNNNFTGALSSNNRRSRVKKANKQNIKINYYKLKSSLIKINILGMFFAVILLASSYSNMVKLSSNNLVLKEEIEGLKTELNNIETIAMTTNSLSRIEKVAKSRLEMSYPDENSYVALENVDKINTAKEKDSKIKMAENDNKSLMSTLGKIFGSGE
ncbi:septum formation initiator family protein [uncultured Helcococcus sp.]|uniref:septum formation initiator family protein n=1 Tax=uncultured Helcococcus sp. TaxID=1072508 RepID=UPI002604AA0C|nr:septum formation initiator family protein [uncultured Helcococcus sp.]